MDLDPRVEKGKREKFTGYHGMFTSQGSRGKGKHGLSVDLDPRVEKGKVYRVSLVSLHPRVVKGRVNKMPG